MLQLDSKTIVFTQFVLSILFAVVFWIMCRIEGGLRAVSEWGGCAFGLVMMSSLFFLPQGHVPRIVVFLGYSGVYGSLACFYCGIVHFLAPTRSSRWIWIAVAVTETVMFVLLFPLWGTIRMSFVYVLGCVFFRGATAYELGRGALGRSFLRYFSIFMWGYAAYALGFFVIDPSRKHPALFGHLSEEIRLYFLLGNFVLSTMCHLLFLLFWGEELLLASGREAITDSLTGLLNRRGVEGHLAGVWREAKINTIPFCVGLIDIDHFKQVNDRFGHARGDDMIREVARSVSMLIRSSDYVGRLGGDEILVVFPSTEVDEARSIAERICDRVNVRRLEPVISVSIGLTEWRFAEPVKDTVDRADAALYGSKNNGRNCVTVEL